MTDRDELAKLTSQRQAIRQAIGEPDESDADWCEAGVQELGSQYTFDPELVGTYAGRDISTEQEAAELFCSATSNAVAVYEFAYAGGSWISGVLQPLCLLLALGGGWGVFVSKHVRTPLLAHLLFAMTLFALISCVFLALLMLGRVVLLPILRQASVYWLEAILVSLFTLFLAWEVISIRKRQVQSLVCEACIAAFPFAATLCLVLLSIALTGGALDSYGVVSGVGAVVCFLLVPYFKAQLVRLLSLPEA
jgi:hypothetical protein